MDLYIVRPSWKMMTITTSGSDGGMSTHVTYETNFCKEWAMTHWTGNTRWGVSSKNSTNYILVLQTTLGKLLHVISTDDIHCSCTVVFNWNWSSDRKIIRLYTIFLFSFFFFFQNRSQINKFAGQDRTRSYFNWSPCSY